MIKPQRFLLGRIAGVADEAAAFVRRRRIAQRPFARVYYRDGRSTGYTSTDEAGRALFLAAAKLLNTSRSDD